MDRVGSAAIANNKARMLAALLQEHASPEPRGEYPMHSVNDARSGANVSVSLGELSALAERAWRSRLAIGEGSMAAVLAGLRES